MIRRWPDSLPPPIGRDYQITLADAARRTQFEIGQRARRITREAHDVHTLSSTLTDLEYAALSAWYHDAPWSLAGASDSVSHWTMVRATRQAGAAIGPDTVACDVIVEDNTLGAHGATRSLGTEWHPGDQCTATVSLQPRGRARARVDILGCDIVSRHVVVDLATHGVIAATDAQAIASEHLGWTRVRISAQVGTGSDPVLLRVFSVDAGTNASFTGSGSAAVAIGQITARRSGLGAGLFLPSDAAGRALGAAGGSASFRCIVAPGDGYQWREVMPLAGMDVSTLTGLRRNVTLPVRVRHA